MSKSISIYRHHLPRLFSCLAAATLGTSAAYADLLPRFPRDCNPPFDDAANVTWYGDSWGDFADSPGYGWLDWESYFEIHQPAANWRVQNLAIGSWTTAAVYERITVCAKTQESRESFRTADNVVLEFGGNDYLAHVPWLSTMPWMYPRIQQRVLSNTEAILVSLRHPRRNKNVLMVGHIPVISASPSLGPPAEYWSAGPIQPRAETIRLMDEILDPNAPAELLSAQLDLLRQIMEEALQRAQTPESVGNLFGPIDEFGRRLRRAGMVLWMAGIE